MALFSSADAVLKLTAISKRKVEKPQGGFEFKSYQEYASFFGVNAIPESKWKGQDAAWLRVDREKNFKRWQVAMHKVTSSNPPLKDRLQPFGQILSYYKQIHVWLDGRGHNIKWVHGAFYLVEDLYEAYEDGLVPGKCPLITSPLLLNILKELNVEIANFAMTQFRRLLYGEYKHQPLMNLAAYEFDRNFIIAEQVFVAYPVYNKYYNILPDGREMLQGMSDIFNEANWIGVIKNLDLTGISIPVLPGYYQSNLAAPTERFGQDARVQVPIGMLYPDFYFVNDPDQRLNDSNDHDNNVYNFNQAFRQALRKGLTTKVNPLTPLSRDLIVYNVYRTVNRVIMEIFKRNFFNE